MQGLSLHLRVFLELDFSHYIWTDHEYESCQGAGLYNSIVKVWLNGNQSIFVDIWVFIQDIRYGHENTSAETLQWKLSQIGCRYYIKKSMNVMQFE